MSLVQFTRLVQNWAELKGIKTLSSVMVGLVINVWQRLGRPRRARHLSISGQQRTSRQQKTSGQQRFSTQRKTSTQRNTLRQLRLSRQRTESSPNIYQMNLKSRAPYHQLPQPRSYYFHKSSLCLNIKKINQHIFQHLVISQLIYIE